MSDPVCDDLSALLKRINRLTQERDEARAGYTRHIIYQMGGDAMRDERDVLAAALAELREASRIVLLYGSDAGLVDLSGAPIADGTGPFARLRATLASTPADLAAAHDARLLREKADQAEVRSLAPFEPDAKISDRDTVTRYHSAAWANVRDWLRAEAECIEQGER